MKHVSIALAAAVIVIVAIKVWQPAVVFDAVCVGAVAGMMFGLAYAQLRYGVAGGSNHTRSVALGLTIGVIAASSAAICFGDVGSWIEIAAVAAGAIAVIAATGIRYLSRGK